MRFLLLTQYYPPEIGAAQSRLRALAVQLKAAGHEVEVVTALPNYPTGQVFPQYRGRWFLRERMDGIVVNRVWLYAATGTGVRRLANYFSFMVTCLFALARCRRPDYLFVESPPLFLSLPAFLVSRWWKCPLIFNVADLWPDSVRELGLMREGLMLRMADWLELWTYRMARYVTAVTEGLRSSLVERKGVPSAKVLYLPNGVDTDLFRPSKADSKVLTELGLDGRRIILYAGTHGYAHGLDVALDAARLVEAEGLHLVLVGDGSEKVRLRKRAANLGLTNVTFLDAMPPEQIARLYSVSLAGLSTLRRSPLFEGTRPVKILAAMACGKPVVYSGEGEGARLIRDAGAGIVVPPEDPQALADALRQVAGNAESATEMGRNGRRYVEAYLSWTSVVGAWLSQLQSGR